MDAKKIERINELAHLSKPRKLTDVEISEQAALRQEYLADIRKSFKAQLDNTVVLYPDGTKEPLRQKKED